MTSNADILLTAQGVIKNHRASAAMVCAQTADRWERRGKIEAASYWKKVMLAVQDLQRDHATFVKL